MLSVHDEGKSGKALQTTKIVEVISSFSITLNTYLTKKDEPICICEFNKDYQNFIGYPSKYMFFNNSKNRNKDKMRC